MSHRFFVVTGGPGSGKTSLIEALAAEGVAHVPEAGRAIIRDQVAIGGTALPWADRAAFAERMFHRDLDAHRAAERHPGPVIFDRGLPDVIGYLTLCGLPVPSAMWQAAERCRYHGRVFLAPFWPEIYGEDAERRQSAEEAEATGRIMARIYTELGYEPVPLPLAPIPERIAFVRAAFEQAGSSPSATAPLP